MPLALLKFGGEIVADRQRLGALLSEVSQLVSDGWRFVLCHGGGPQATQASKRVGLENTMVAGRRVTDEPTLQVMKWVLAGELSVDVVSVALASGILGVGISGVSAGLLTARRRPPRVMAGAGDAPVDFGLVGDIVEVKTELLRTLLDAGYVPVVNTLGVDSAGEPARPVYNINADTGAAAIAMALAVDHLFLVTGVPGVLRDRNDPSTRYPVLDPERAAAAIADGSIAGGMIPKVEEAFACVRAGVGAVHILSDDPEGFRAAAREPGRSGTVLRARV